MARAKIEEFADLPFLAERTAPVVPARVARDALASLAVHIALIAALLSLPDLSTPARAPVIVADIRKSVTIVAPRFTDLTQKDPNKGKVSRSVDANSAVSTPVPQAPRVIPTGPLPGPAVRPEPPTPIPAPVPVIEPPKIEIATGGVPIPSTGTAAQLPPPAEKPKLAFESVASAAVRSSTNTPAIASPKNSVQEIARAAVRPGGGGIVVGDDLEQPPNLGSFNQAPIPGRMGSNLQLLSDPSGVDFKPYLIQVLAAVRRNWMNVIPESARLGRRGQVLLQFIVDRQGKIPKLVIASESGTSAFDRAAVAGVQLSLPFPPLPANYKGDEIRLQLAFSYNVPR